MPDTVPAVSDETKEMIEDHVKKGKARKFFLISKGATITALEVFKKGPFGPRVMKAKKEGLKGEVTYGVVTGQGKELYFQLAGNQAVAEAMKIDSFTEEPPTKRAKLREFLSDNGLTFKCNYYIITNLSDAPDPEGESAAKAPPASALARDDEAGGETTESETDESVEETTPIAPPTQSGTSLFTERLKTLKPGIDSAIAGGGPIGEEVKLRLSEAGMFARKKEFDEANAILDKIEEMLKKAASTPPVPPPQPKVDLSGQFNKRLAEVVARVKEAAGTPSGNEAKLKLSEAGTFARKKEFEQANALLDEVEQLLDEVPSSESESEEEEGSKSALEEWKTARGDVVKQLHALGKAIAASGDPETKDAIILIKAIAANLTEKPETERQVDELLKYLVDDDIIGEAEEENGFGIEIRIRETLMPVLEKLKAEHTA